MEFTISLRAWPASVLHLATKEVSVTLSSPPQVPALLELLLGGNPVDNTAAYHDSSPVSYVTRNSCPTLLFQGGKDALVNPKQAELLRDKLKKEGVVNELIVYPNEGHGWHGKSLGDSFDNITRFLGENLP